MRLKQQLLTRQALGHICQASTQGCCIALFQQGRAGPQLAQPIERAAIHGCSRCFCNCFHSFMRPKTRFWCGAQTRKIPNRQVVDRSATTAPQQRSSQMTASGCKLRAIRLLCSC